MDELKIKLTEDMKKDMECCNEDLCTSEDCTLWLENAGCCLLELTSDNQTLNKQKGEKRYDEIK